jgi:hypothetical protein
MSSILNALKKLERDKTARTQDSLKIEAEILRGGSTPRSPYLLYTSLVAVLFFVCGGAATYMYVKNGKSVTDAQQAATGASSGATSNPSPQAQAVQVIHVATRKHQVKEPGVKAPPSSLLAKLPARLTARSAPTVPSTGTGHPAVVAAQAPPSVAAETAPRIPTLKVDGIAYHMGSAESLAVINGVTAYVGAVIEGAKVEEIGKDWIRFSYGGEKLIVPFGKSNR